MIDGLVVGAPGRWGSLKAKARGGAASAPS
jgi:hypothetical protein